MRYEMYVDLLISVTKCFAVKLQIGPKRPIVSQVFIQIKVFPTLLDFNLRPHEHDNYFGFPVLLPKFLLFLLL